MGELDLGLPAHRNQEMRFFPVTRLCRILAATQPFVLNELPT